MPANGIAVAKNSGRPGTRFSGWRTYGMIFSAGCLVHALTPGERQRRAHELQELPAALRVVPLGRLLGELPVQVFPELQGVGELAQAAPVQAAVGPGQSRSDCVEIHN